MDTSLFRRHLHDALATTADRVHPSATQRRQIVWAARTTLGSRSTRPRERRRAPSCRGMNSLGPMSQGIAAVCVACGSEFTSLYRRSTCLDCGGQLRRSDGTLIDVDETSVDLANGEDEWFVHLDRATYLGGHPRHPEPVPNAIVTVLSGVINVRDSDGQSGFSFAASEITSIEVDGPMEVQKRVTVPRVLALGVYALAVPKAERLSYLVINTIEREAIVEVRSLTSMELRAALQPMAGLLLAPSAAEKLSEHERAQASPRDRLLELKGLHDEGLISDDEYESRRERVMDNL